MAAGPLNPINWRDGYQRSAERIVLTEGELRVPGLRCLGWQENRQAESALEWHFHENCFEVAIVLRGSINFFTRDACFAVSGGDAFLARPGEPHGTNGTPLAVCELCWLQLDVSDPSRFLFLEREAADALIDALRRSDAHLLRADAERARLLLKMLLDAALPASRQASRHQIASYAVACLYQLLSFGASNRARVTPDIARVCAYIDENLREAITLEQLAEICHLSLSQFKSKFKAQLGASPRDYINRIKVRRIAQQLSRGSVLTRVAGDYSFCNSAYFAAVFKKYTGLTPTQYIAALPARKRGD